MENEGFALSDLFRAEQTDNESEKPTDCCHVTPLRSSRTENEDERFPLNLEADSLALLSVHRYAGKIKHFLGWKEVKEDSEQEEDNENVSNTTLTKKESSSSSEPVEVKQPPTNTDSINQETTSTSKEADDRNDENGSNILEEPNKRGCSPITKEYLSDIEPGNEQQQSFGSSKSINQQNDNKSKISDDGFDVKGSNDFEEPNKRSSSYLEVADYSDIGLKEDISAVTKSLVTGENKSYLNARETENENSTDNDILRSQINLIINDNEVDLSLTKHDEPLEMYKYSDNSINNDQNEPVANENDSKVSDLLLSVENAINKIGLMTTSNNGADSTKKLNAENINEEAKKEETLMTEQNPKLLDIKNTDNLMNDNSSYEALTYKTEQKERTFIEKSKQDYDVLQIKDDANKYVTSENNKDLTNPKEKENQVNNTTKFKNDHSFKAYIDYESQKKKKTASNDREDHTSRRESTSSTEDTVCGLWFFKPQCIQPCASAKVYVILYSIIGILHGSYYSYLIGTLSTLEKRFAFKSKISGAIMVADEVTPLLLGMIIGYYAGKAHRPRIIAFGMLLSAACCFCTSLPYFIYGPVQHFTFKDVLSSKGTEYCDPASGTEACSASDRPPTLPAVLLLVFGSFLKGFGNLAYYAIGLAYLDDNSDKKSTPIYLAIALALRLLGPLLGFLMSSGFLKLYENPLHDPGYGPEDPRWIGAWWIGFFLQGVLLIIFTLPIGLFPRRLPGQKLLTKATAFTTENSLKEIFVGLVAALKRLGRNPVFVLLIINTTMKIFGHFGHAIMLPKYMENQFRLSASEASLFSGATSITCIMVSTLLGGFLVWKFRPGLRALLGGMIASEAIMCIGFLLLMIPRCKTANMLNFGVDDEGLVLNSVCNSNCDCSTTSFTPFCGQDGETMYFSPCYAGCTEELASVMSPKKHKVFGNCSCVNSATYQNNKTIVSEGFCPDENCWSQTLAYLIILFLVIAISNLFTVVHTMILLRSVHPNDKSVALGTFETFLCLFGFIPFPVTYGALVDSACLVWEKSCGETGNCWFYDADRYRYLLHGASALFCFLSVLCLTLLYCLRSRVRDLYHDEEEEEKGYVDIKLDTVSDSVTKL